MTDRHVTYLTLDPVGEGVGTSQVARYVMALPARGIAVTLHSFERTSPSQQLADDLQRAGVTWHVHAFGGLGARGGLSRLARATIAIRRAPLVHARSDLAAAAASSRERAWVWDMRAFFADQRIALGTLRPGSAEDRALRSIERRSAQRAAGIVTLANAAVPIMESRHGLSVAAKCRVITTCVDLDRFELSELPKGRPVFLLAGTLNTYYDVPAMLALAGRARATRRSCLVVASPEQSAWETALSIADSRIAVSPLEMPRVITEAHVGLCICRADAGVSLRAAMPTKLGEFLATGRPVIVNAGLGDMDEIIRRHKCGVVLDGSSPESIDRALTELDALIADTNTPARCRNAAETHFDLHRGVDELVKIYESIS